MIVVGVGVLLAELWQGGQTRDIGEMLLKWNVHSPAYVWMWRAGERGFKVKSREASNARV